VQCIPLQPGSQVGVESTAHHPGSRGVADFACVMPLFNIKDLAAARCISTGAAC